MTPRTRTALITGAAVVALVAGGGVAYAVSSAPTSTSTPAASPAPAKAKHHKQLLGHVAHGEVTLDGKDHRVVDVQRGEVQSVSSTSIAVKSDDGFTATYTVNNDSKIRKGGQQSAIADVHTGDKVGVVATKANGVATVTRIAEKK
jgi:Cu/Ag efflux protein CusF